LHREPDDDDRLLVGGAGGQQQRGIRQREVDRAFYHQRRQADDCYLPTEAIL
jgi:hypothetical protein